MDHVKDGSPKTGGTLKKWKDREGTSVTNWVEGACPR